MAALYDGLYTDQRQEAQRPESNPYDLAEGYLTGWLQPGYENTVYSETEPLIPNDQLRSTLNAQLHPDEIRWLHQYCGQSGQSMRNLQMIAEMVVPDFNGKDKPGVLWAVKMPATEELAPELLLLNMSNEDRQAERAEQLPSGEMYANRSRFIRVSPSVYWKNWHVVSDATPYKRPALQVRISQRGDVTFASPIVVGRDGNPNVPGYNRPIHILRPPEPADAELPSLERGQRFLEQHRRIGRLLMNLLDGVEDVLYWDFGRSRRKQT